MLIAVIMATVLFGMAGLAVDVGHIYAERKALRNGADAAVLAIAEDCARGTAPCDLPTATATADAYADANARDGAANIDSVDLDLVEQQVTVVTSTHDAATGGIVLRPFFAQLVGFPGVTVRAQATARWGTLGSARTVPITMSECDIRDDEGNLRYDEIFTVTFVDPSGDTCDAHPGFDADDDGLLPAGFGWLRPTDEDPCVAFTLAFDYPTADMWAFQDPGADPARGCLDIDVPFLIPIFVDVMFQTNPDCDAINPHPTNCYGIGGYAHFTITGFRFPGYQAGSPGCSPPQSCITGYIDQFTTTGEMGSSFDFGVVVVELIG